MKILVSNIGSTSFKFKLFDQARDEAVIASGGADRIGNPGGVIKLALGEVASETSRDFADHGECIRYVMDQLVDSGVLQSPGDLDAVAFKAVMGGECDPVELVDDTLLARMERFIPVAPAHNPPYIAAMRMFREVLSDTPLVAAFEPGFHMTNPPRRRVYATPPYWATDHGVKRYGFHGASHRYIATKMAELVPDATRIISCHLGGSSSLCAIRDGESVATSMGLSAQSGLPQSSRCGDFDAYGLKLMAMETGRDLDDLLAELGSKAGLAALSGTSGDMRDVREGILAGDEQCQLAFSIFATSIRDYLGAYLVELGGADAIVFTGGIGQHDTMLRATVLDGLEFAGIKVDDQANDATTEGAFHAADSATQLWALETNEELIVARLAATLLAGQ
jgi:acetate kinase